MAISWSRVADMAQRSLSLVLSGLTLVGVAILARGGYGIMQRKKNRELIAKEQQETQQMYRAVADEVGMVLSRAM